MTTIDSAVRRHARTSLRMLPVCCRTLLGDTGSDGGRPPARDLHGDRDGSRGCRGRGRGTPHSIRVRHCFRRFLGIECPCGSDLLL